MVWSFRVPRVQGLESRARGLPARPQPQPFRPGARLHGLGCPARLPQALARHKPRARQHAPAETGRASLEVAERTFIALFGNRVRKPGSETEAVRGDISVGVFEKTILLLQSSARRELMMRGGRNRRVPSVAVASLLPPRDDSPSGRRRPGPRRPARVVGGARRRSARFPHAERP